MENSLTNFFLNYRKKLFNNRTFRKQILSQQQFFKIKDQHNKKALFNKIFDLIIEEAQLTLNLILGIDLKNKKLLEVGSGLGLVYAYLQKKGYNIYGIEPSDSGFSVNYQAALKLFSILKINPSHYYSYKAIDCPKLNLKFDLIFSNNVLEHIPNLSTTFPAIASVLKPDGIMIHNTVNYHIPYEPHFKIFIFPFLPKLTSLIKTSLKNNHLWNGLNFITTSSLIELCRLNGLLIVFQKDRLRKTFERFDTDPEFSKRQVFLLPVYKILKYTGILRLLDNIPVSLTTPITFNVRKQSTRHF